MAKTAGSPLLPTHATFFAVQLDRVAPNFVALQLEQIFHGFRLRPGLVAELTARGALDLAEQLAEAAHKAMMLAAETIEDLPVEHT